MSKDYAWRTGRTCVYKLFYHLVFVTKYRRGVFTKTMIKRLDSIFRETCQQMDSELLEFNGESDHVHLMVSVAPKHALSNVVGKLKGKSSYFIRQEYSKQLENKLWGDHLWSPSYCAVSCGGAPLEVIKQYIENQQTPTEEKYVKQSKSISGDNHHTRRTN